MIQTQLNNKKSCLKVFVAQRKEINIYYTVKDQKSRIFIK